MADFCKQCSIDLFCEDFGELASITDPNEWKLGKACTVICEGCGPIQVDPEGNCVSADCMRAGHSLEWIKQELNEDNQK